MERQPLIDEMVDFIEKQQPNKIEKIRNDYPEFQDILKAGTLCGESDNQDELEVRAKVCFSALDIVVATCKENMPKIKNRLKSSQKIQLWGQILSTISSASVISTLATDHKNITYIAGGFSLMGTLVPLIVDFQKKGLDKNKQLDENYAELMRMQLEAEQNSKELNFFVKNGFNVEGISEVINKSNQLCYDINLRLSFV